MKRSLLTAITILLGLMPNSPLALAQGNPDTNQIIQSLTPQTPDMRTRGIRPTGENPPAAAPSVNLTVQFQTGSAQLTAGAQQTLDQLGQALTSSTLSSYRFRIEGHTDTVGAPATNMSLSEQRAAAVASYLESKFAVAPQRIETVGKGDTEPLVQTPPQTPEPRNRRVQVVNIGA